MNEEYIFDDRMDISPLEAIQRKLLEVTKGSVVSSLHNIRAIRMPSKQKEKVMYSEKEKAMFKSLGYEDLTDFLEPYSLYRVAVEDAFINNLNGPYVESLRRTAKAFMHDSVQNRIFRLTEEFDNLIYKE